MLKKFLVFKFNRLIFHDDNHFRACFFCLNGCLRKYFRRSPVNDTKTDVKLVVVLFTLLFVFSAIYFKKRVVIIVPTEAATP